MENLTHPYSPSLPLPDDGYVRAFEAEIDYLEDKTMRVSGIQTDHRHSLQYTWVVSLPDYEIVHASAQHLSGEPTVLSPQLLSRCTTIRGAQTSQGITKIIRTALGDLPGKQEHLALAVEMARVSLQGFPVPNGDHERFASVAETLPPGPTQVARMSWERDRVDWSWICNSCYAYRDESETLFKERDVTCFDLDLVSPEPGQKRFFWRKKELKICRRPDGFGFLCHNEMNDTFHALGVSFDIGSDGTISAAESQWQRLAYQGICEDTQTRTPALVGKKLDKRYARLLADHVGGRSGCSHLFDLSVDCVRFFEWQV